MENVKTTEPAGWLQDSLACLAPPAEWEPSATAAQARLSARREHRVSRTRYWLLVAAVGAMGAFAITASSNARAIAQQCWQCIAGAGLEMALHTKATRGIVPIHARSAAPDFALPDATGRLIHLSGYQGRVVLLDFWATWCGGCKVEIPWYQEFANRYGEDGLTVLGVSMDEEGWKAIRPFIAQKQMHYPIVLGGDKIAKLYGISAMPVTLLIDRAGKIAATHVGVVDKRLFENELSSLLAEPYLK